MAKRKLRPCPFCGAKVKISYWPGNPPTWDIGCPEVSVSKCPVRPRMVDSTLSRKEAEDAWNGALAARAKA